MKWMLLAVGAMTLMMGGVPSAQAETPVIDQRQANQEQRIDKGIESGQLNQREAIRLKKQQDHIDNMENKAKADSVVTNKERARIGAAQIRTSRNIVREKHDRQGKRQQ